MNNYPAGITENTFTERFKDEDDRIIEEMEQASRADFKCEQWLDKQMEAHRDVH